MLTGLSHENKKIIAGMIFIALVCAFTAFSLNIRSWKAGTERGVYKVFAVFKRVSSLNVGSDVYIAGIRKGKVAGLELNDDYTVRAKLELNIDFALPEDSTFSIHTDGIVGKKYIEIAVGGDDDNLIPDKGYASYTQDSVDLDELIEQIMAMARKKNEKQKAGDNEKKSF